MRTNLFLTIGFALALSLSFSTRAIAQPGPPAGPPPLPKAAAPFDLTGYWVAIVTEDWRFRMVVAPKGDYPGVPLNAEGKKIADSWDPTKEDASGEPCKAYGAPAIMRVPGRLHITWQDDKTLKVEMDAGTQTRILNFGGTPTGGPSLQGYSAADWEPLLGGGGFGPHKPGSLKIITTRVRPGFLRKNGVPYSANATMTEFWDLMNDPNSGETWLLVKTLVNDPTYMTEPFITSTHFRKQADATGFAPSACSPR